MPDHGPIVVYQSTLPIHFFICFCFHHKGTGSLFQDGFEMGEARVFTFHSGSEVNTKIGILLDRRSFQLPFQQIQAAATSFKAFNLVIIPVEKVREK